MATPEQVEVALRYLVADVTDLKRAQREGATVAEDQADIEALEVVIADVQRELTISASLLTVGGG